MPVDNWIDLGPPLLACAIWVIALGLTLQYGLAAVGLDGFSAGHEGGPEDLVPDGTDSLYDDFYRQLLALGMRPAGITWEKIAAKPAIKSFAFLHPTEAYRASVWRLLGGDFRAYWITQFRDDGAVLTANYPRRTWASPGYLARGIAMLNLAELLDCHRRDVAAMVATGKEPLRCSTLDDVVQAKIAYHHSPMVRPRYQRTQWVNFLGRILVVGGLPTVLALVASNQRWFTSATSAWLLGLTACIGLAIQLGRQRHSFLQKMTDAQRGSVFHERRSGGR